MPNWQTTFINILVAAELYLVRVLVMPWPTYNVIDWYGVSGGRRLQEGPYSSLRGTVVNTYDYLSQIQ